MAVANTTLLSFEVSVSTFKNRDDLRLLHREIDHHLEGLGFKKACSYGKYIPEKEGFLDQYLNGNLSHATLRGYPSGLITLDLHECVTQGCDPQFSPEVVAKLEHQIKGSLHAFRSISHPAIKRGADVNVYYHTMDGRFIEYDIDEIVFEEDSKYQNVRIAHSKTFGNMLILDGDPNLAESDVLYSHSMMRQGVNDFTDKNCLILGGGDGGLLNELRKEKPKWITMVDIDECVLQAAKKHLRGICTDSLDSYHGENYEVIVGDAIAFLKKAIASGKKFDYVLGDLTVVPITPVAMGDEWDFLRLVLDLSLKVLTDDGKLLTHANALLANHAISMFETELNKLNGYRWNRIEAHIPSFHEMWTFYEIESKNS